MTLDFYRKVIRSGIVDTRKYRYIVTDTDEQQDVIKRLPLDSLDTVKALTDWTIVSRGGEKHD